MTSPPSCPRCGTLIAGDSHFCRKCGSDVTQHLSGGAVASQGDPNATVVAPSDATIAANAPTAVLGSAKDVHASMLENLRSATLGEYDVLSELGRGGMATVFLAHDIALDRKVAIKVMAPHLLEGDGMVERFKLEARTAAQLSHPHIIPIYAVKWTDNTIYFVMKFIEGRPLDDIIKKMAPLPIPMVKDILTKVGGALGYGHRRDVVHRDIKPANIMIDEEGTPIVTDFGIAKVATEGVGLTMTGTTIGTPSYMSPEQCEARDVTGASDQYSLGVLAWEMLTGRVPFEGKTAVSTMYKHCHESLPPLLDGRPDCPPDLLETVERMLAKDPKDRWPTLEAAIKRLGPDATMSYADPVHSQLVDLVKQGDHRELLARIQTPRSPIPVGRVGESTPAPATTGPAAAGGKRSWVAAAAAVVILGGGGTLAVLQPWAAGGADTAIELNDPDAGESNAVAGGGGQPLEPGNEGDNVGSETDAGSLAEGGESEAGPDAGGGEAPEEVPPDPEPEVNTGGSGGSGPSSRPPPTPTPVAVASVVLDGVPDRDLAEGTSYSVAAIARDASSRTLSGRTATWSSSNSGVAEVRGGQLIARSPGTATITATIEGESARASVTVVAEAVSYVTLEPETLSLTEGDNSRLRALAYSAGGEPLALEGRTVSWSSLDETVATVGQDGVVRAVAAGDATIQVSIDGVTETVIVRASRALVSAQTAAPQLIQRFARALEAKDVGQIRAVFPEIGEAQLQGFQQLFDAFDAIDADLTVGRVDVTGDGLAVATANGAYHLTNGGDVTDQPISLTADLERRPSGAWVIRALR